MENAFERRIKSKMPTMQHVILEHHRECCPGRSEEFLDEIERKKHTAALHNWNDAVFVLHDLREKYLETHGKKD
jgi:hypothetical protein